MMLEKLTKLAEKDPLLFHKLGIALGSAVGLVLGLVVSDQADQYDVEIIEEVPNGTETS